MAERYKFILKTLEEAGELLLKIQQEGFGISSKEGDYRNIVTEADITINDFIKKEINKNFPGERIYSEEGGGALESEGFLWVIDPIDGTSNFARNIPHFAVVISCLSLGEVVACGVYNPITKELFSFEKESGAFLNGDKISVKLTESLRESYVLLHIGREEENRSWGLSLEEFFLLSAKKTLNLGSSSLDLCFLASGRVDLVVYGTLTTMDIVGVISIVRASGGEVYGDDSKPVSISDSPQKIFGVANEKLLAEINS